MLNKFQVLFAQQKYLKKMNRIHCERNKLLSEENKAFTEFMKESEDIQEVEKKDYVSASKYLFCTASDGNKHIIN